MLADSRGGVWGLTQILPQYSPISGLLGHGPQCLFFFLAVLGVRCCVSRLSLVATSGSYSLVVERVLLISVVLLLQSTGSRAYRLQ